jgi:hypothetical protein
MYEHFQSPHIYNDPSGASFAHTFGNQLLKYLSYSASDLAANEDELNVFDKLYGGSIIIKLADSSGMLSSTSKISALIKWFEKSVVTVIA